MVEVKSRTWCTTGTAGEKVLGVPYKYADVPNLYNKPLMIVCVAYQEWELTHGTTRVFGDVPPRQQRLLDIYANEMDITFMKFSDLVTQMREKQDKQSGQKEDMQSGQKQEKQSGQKEETPSGQKE